MQLISPDPGRPLIPNAAAFDLNNSYGTSQDHDHVESDMFTSILMHGFSANIAAHNTLRWGRTRQDYLLTSFMANAAKLLTPGLFDAWSRTAPRSNPNFKNQANRIATTQTNITANFQTGAVTHNLSAGFELSQEKATTLGMASLRGSAWSTANLCHPDARARSSCPTSR